MLALCLHNRKERQRVSNLYWQRSESEEDSSEFSSPERDSLQEVSEEVVVPVAAKAAQAALPPSSIAAIRDVLRESQKPFRMDIREALVGTDKKFECQVIGFPPPNIRWFKDNVEITHDQRYRFSHNHDDGVVSMRIESIKLDDAGLYMCRAENCEGYAITAAHLQVKAHRAHLSTTDHHVESVRMTTVKEVGVTKTEESPIASSRRRPLMMTPSTEEADENANKIKESPPKFVNALENISCQEETTIKVSCKVKGEPRPVVNWFRDGKLLKQDGSCTFSIKQDEYILEIQQCSILDTGEYTCTATNCQGVVSCSFNIHVEGRPISAHELSAVEEENTTDAQSDHDKESLFFRGLFMIRDYHDSNKNISFKYGDCVEVLDTHRDDRWLVRKKEDALQVSYVPRTFLAESLADKPTLAAEEQMTTTDSTKTSKQKREKMRRSSSLRKSSELDDSSGEDDTKHPTETVPLVYVAVADYESSEVRVYEGQFLDVLDQSNPHMWLIRTKPTKVNPSKVGWMPASYLELKDGGGHVDRRSTREVFREDIIQITNKPAEAKIKRRYALTDLLEAERDYVNDLTELIEKLEAEDQEKFLNKETIHEELMELAEFHRAVFLPEVTECADKPANVADVFMKWADSQQDEARQAKQKYFQKPISQLKKYESLLKDFIRYTTRAGEDCSKLEKTLNMLLLVIKAIEDQMILNNIFGCPDDVKSMGHVMRHDTLTVWEGEAVDGKERVRHIFLFPNELLITKPVKTAGAEEYEFKASVPLKGVRIYAGSEQTEPDRRFEIFYTSKTGKVDCYVLHAKNEFSKEAWVRDTTDTVRRLGIENCTLSDKERTDFRAKKQLSDTKTVGAKKKLTGDEVEPERAKKGGYITGTETEQYLTGVETDGSNYFTAAEYEDGTTKPAFRRKFKPSKILEGSNARIVCEISGEPKPTVTWFKDEKPLKESRNVKVIQKGDEHILILTCVIRRDKGVYKVKATNSKGAAECSATIDIVSNPADVTTEDVEYEAATGSKVEATAGFKPKFLKALKAEVSEDGRTARIDCSISAVPEPDVVWFFNKKQLGNSDSRYKFLFVDDESHSLIINDLTVNDSGDYTVVASNSHGSTQTVATVKADLIKTKQTLSAADKTVAAESTKKEESEKVKKKIVPERVSKEESEKVETKVVAEPVRKEESEKVERKAVSEPVNKKENVAVASTVASEPVPIDNLGKGDKKRVTEPVQTEEALKSENKAASEPVQTEEVHKAENKAASEPVKKEESGEVIEKVASKLVQKEESDNVVKKKISEPDKTKESDKKEKLLSQPVPISESSVTVLEPVRVELNQVSEFSGEVVEIPAEKADHARKGAVSSKPVVSAVKINTSEPTTVAEAELEAGLSQVSETFPDQSSAAKTEVVFDKLEKPDNIVEPLHAEVDQTAEVVINKIAGEIPSEKRDHARKGFQGVKPTAATADVIKPEITKIVEVKIETGLIEVSDHVAETVIAKNGAQTDIVIENGEQPITIVEPVHAEVDQVDNSLLAVEKTLEKTGKVLIEKPDHAIKAKAFVPSPSNAEVGTKVVLLLDPIQDEEQNLAACTAVSETIPQLGTTDLQPSVESITSSTDREGLASSAKDKPEKVLMKPEAMEEPITPSIPSSSERELASPATRDSRLPAVYQEKTTSSDNAVNHATYKAQEIQDLVQPDTREAEDVAKANRITHSDITETSAKVMAQKGQTEQEDKSQIHLPLLEEIDFERMSIKRPPKARLVSTPSRDGDFDDDFHSSSILLNEKSKDGLGFARSSRPRLEGPPPALEDPPRVVSCGRDIFILSWVVPQELTGLDSITYDVEMCESGRDWKRIKSGLRNNSLELDTPWVTSRYRVVVVNEYGKSLPSLSIVVHAQKDKESSLLDKLERRYGISDHPIDIVSHPLVEYDNDFFKNGDIKWSSFANTDITSFKFEQQLLNAYAHGIPIGPRFSDKDPELQYAIEGQKARVMCTLFSHPESDIRWYFKGEKIMMGERYNCHLYPSGLCILEFDHMSWDDAGEYKITVTNRFGFRAKILQLGVSDPPTFLETPNTTYLLNRLDTLRLCVRADGIPYPKISFYKDWQRIPSGSRCQVLQECPDTYSLLINGVLVRDSGTYQIVAENEAGRIHCTVHVAVEDKTAKESDVVAVKRYLLEDHYYILEEIRRDCNSIVHRVIERTTGIEMHARIFTNPSSFVRRDAHRQMMVMQSASHPNIIRLVNVIENQQQVVILYEIVTTTWVDILFTYINWTESYAAYCIKDLLLIIKYLHGASVSLANLQLSNIFCDEKSQQLKLDLYQSGWLLNAESHRSKYSGVQSYYLAPEVIAGEVNINSDMWNVGIIAFMLLGGVPSVSSDGKSMQVDTQTLKGVCDEAKDFISKLLQHDCSKRLTVEDALRHAWLKTASAHNQGSPLDISAVREFFSKGQITVDKQGEKHKTEADVIKYTSSSAADEALLVDWFAKYKQGADTYLVPIRELDLPLRLREYRRHNSNQTVVNERELFWQSHTVRTRELPGSPDEDEASSMELTRAELLVLANEGLAHIEQQASQASGSAPEPKAQVIFRQRLETTALKVGEAVNLCCEIECNDLDMMAFWYRNDEILIGDIEKNSVLICDRFTFSYAKDGKLKLEIRNAVPHDAGVYKCQVRNKANSAFTKARLLVGDVPGEPCRPIAATVWDTQAYVVWAAPSTDGNSPIRKYKLDCKMQDGDRWTTCLYTQTTAAVVHNLLPNTVYWFRVAAINQFGFSAYSWASPEVKTAKTGSVTINYTADMNRVEKLSLTSIAQEAGATCSAMVVSPLSSCRSSLCDSLEEVTVNKGRAQDLYRFTQELVQSFQTGSLYKCQRKDTGRFYVASAAEHTSATETELRLLKTLHHNHIQRLFAIYDQPTHYTLVYHSLSRENILQRIARKALFSERLVTEAINQMAGAVEYLHFHDIIHCDVHPYNMVMASPVSERIILTDFGNARKQGDYRPMVSPGFTEFKAPEVLLNEDVSKSTDVWGLGLSTFILLSGISPFSSDSELSTRDNIQYLRFRISSLYPNSSALAHKFIFSCLRRVPGNRLSMAEVVNHQWLDIGCKLHQKVDDHFFPSVGFHSLIARLDDLRRMLFPEHKAVVW